jgi:hypothetical protein
MSTNVNNLSINNANTNVNTNVNTNELNLNSFDKLNLQNGFNRECFDLLLAIDELNEDFDSLFGNLANPLLAI